MDSTEANLLWQVVSVHLMALLAVCVVWGCQAPSQAEPVTPHVIVVSIDGLRADRCHFEGNPRPTTPNLDILAQNGVHLSAAFSQSNESLLSHAALLTGRYPSEISPIDPISYRVPEQILTLPEALSAVGYDTAAFVAGGHVRSELGLAQGFALWEQASEFGSFFETVPQALAWMKERTDTRPFFALVHGYDVHRPYAHEHVFYHPFDADYEGPMEALVTQRNATERIYRGTYYPQLDWPKLTHQTGMVFSDPSLYTQLVAGNAGLGTPLNPADIDHMVAHYDSGVLAADTWVGLLVDGLVEQDLWEETVVLIVSDHGEDLQTHGFTNHRPVVYDSTTRVPWLVAGGALPEAWRGREITELVDAVDLTATVMALAESVPPAGTRGRDALASLRGKASEPKWVLQQGVLGQLALRTQTNRLVFSGRHPSDADFEQVLTHAPIGQGAFVLTDPLTDPQEQLNLLAKPTEEDLSRAEELRATMVERWRVLEQASRPAQPPSPALKKLLAEGGYW